MMTDADTAATLAARLVPGDAALQAELTAKLMRKPAVLAQAVLDMDAAERAMVREARVYLRGLTDIVTERVRQHQPPRKVAA